ncbi:hypothetical protein UA38_11660 [Photobacterium kishitanii]|uniref:Uncharacterized protein n=1 Tax=Photobacterium kishitanii TaxID=318456 RepID=A0AAX0YR42_9GAMM|nr:hypothetical protein [Photobacterium kishitanii]KJG57026.1 hypothetical protein UA38_11660 [Photobacterium kishitanii]KJG60550.1 hypothetical protein UA42_14445 [Photobacterium kishitanii]KJG64852.1 hypothetical protein UA40_14140 [Photobacterium kishitanii]KJG68488.1 hypothetical protein UA41_16550 [Photobacterium kishitanii]OBU31229.1 hypothetical protein AYY23_20160 [Photobacterium kishitanii]
METFQAKRQFKIGHIQISDPAPQCDLTIIFQILCNQFPSLRHTNGIYESDGYLDVESGIVTYTIPLIPPKTNG